MARDDTIKSTIELKKRLVLSVNADVVPASDSKEDRNIAEFIEWMLYNAFQIKFWDTLDNYLDAMIYGFKVGEIVWDSAASAEKKHIAVPSEYQDKWIVTNIKHKHSVFFDFDYDKYGNLDKLYIGRNYGDDTIIEKKDLYQKFLIFVYPYVKDGNWYGDSDLKELYTNWYAKWHIFRFRNMWLEKWGNPIPEVRYDKTKLSENEKSDLEDMMKNFQDSMYFINPASWNTEAKELVGKFKFILHEVKKGNATDQFEKAIDQIDAQIRRKLLMPDQLGFTQTDTGAYARSKTEFNIFIKIIEDLHGRLENLINGFFKVVVDFNYNNIKEYPTWQFDKMSQKIEEDMLKILVENSIIDPHEKWIRKYTGIPELSKKEEKELEKNNEKKKEKEKTEKEITAYLGLVLAKNKMQRNKIPVNFKKIEKQYDTFENEFIKDYKKIYLDNVKWLTVQIKRKKIIEEKNEKLVQTLKIKKTELRQLFSEYYAKFYFTGKIDAIEEIQSRLKKIEFKNEYIEFQTEEAWLDRKWVDSLLAEYGELGILDKVDTEALKQIRDRAFAITGRTEDDMVKICGNTIHEGFRSGESAKDIIAKVEANLTADIGKYALTIARTNASDYYNTGRMNFFSSEGISRFIEAYQYSAILDDRTTLFCENQNERIIKKGDPDLGMITPPNHFNCRSLLVAILIEEKNNPDNYYYDYENRFKSWNYNLRPEKGFGS